MIKKTDTQRNGCEECSLDKALALVNWMLTEWFEK